MDNFVLQILGRKGKAIFSVVWMLTPSKPKWSKLFPL